MIYQEVANGGGIEVSNDPRLTKKLCHGLRVGLSEAPILRPATYIVLDSHRIPAAV